MVTPITRKGWSTPLRGSTTIAPSCPPFNVFGSTLYFAILIAWVILVFHVFHVFHDLMRRHDLTGAATALWVLIIFVLPLLGYFLDLILHGGDMHLRQERVVQMHANHSRTTFAT